MDEAPFGHEPSGIAVRRILAIGAILALMVVVSVTLIDVVLRRWVIPQHARIVTQRASLPPPPRLQSDPSRDLAALRAQKQGLLSTWRWESAAHDFARIPIDQAMALYVQQHTTSQPVNDNAIESSFQSQERVPLSHASGTRAPVDLLTRVAFEQRLGGQAPLEATFREVNGATVALGSLLHGRPSLLVPGYYACVNLCGVIRAGVAHAVERSGLVPGEQFNVVLVSVDPRETEPEARAAQRNDALSHPRAHVANWHYLTGPPAARDALMRAIGFRSWFDARNGQYAHASGIVLLSPQGAVTQYLFGVQFEPQTLRLALVNASQGRIGTIVDRLLLLCCDYDPSTGRYGLLINRVLQVLGIATALALAGLIVAMRRKESQRGSQPERP